MDNVPEEFIIEISSFMNDNDVEMMDSKLDLYDIVNKYLEKNQGDDSFMIVDVGDIIRQYNKWKKMLPRITPFYAIKCNPSTIVLDLLHKLGCSFDCASKNEISRVISIGVDPDRIIFANPCKMITQIKYARANDIDLLTFDSSHELYKIKLYHPNARLLLRLKVDDSKSMCKFNSKFGVELEEVLPILTLARQLDIDVCGVSFHVGSGCRDAQVYHSALEICSKVFQISADDVQKPMNTVDIGGGFPGIDVGDIQFETICDVINTAIDEFFPDPNIRLIAEPGRYFVSSSHTLVVSIINKKEITDKQTGELTNIYYISDGIYGSFSGILFDYAQLELLPFNERNEKTFQSIVFGPTCDSLDIISKECQLPSLAIGESILIRNIGAYSTASATEFNGFTKPYCYYIMS
uniref:ornithine decarboxylase n=1 Tax=viral metagenome TaxID=1070528 RepID=A0A6C0K149_9ZZZZ